MEPKTNYKKAAFWHRAAAFIIDTLILLIPILILIQISRLMHFNSPWIIRLIEFIIISFYNVFFISTTGATIGKKILKLKAVSTNYEDVTLKQVLLREVIGKFISQIVFGLGFVWALGNGRRQTWHDRIASTYVIKLGADHNPIEEENSKPTLIEKLIFILYSLFIILSIILGLFFALIAHPVRMSTSSMEPTYKKGAYLLVLNHANPKHYDVISYKIFIKGHPQTLIKRVIGLPGEKVGLAYSKVFINGHVLKEESVLGKNITTSGGSFLANNKLRLVTKNSYFVLGDNRTASLDSRDMGFVPAQNITGRILICYWNCR